LSGGRRLFGQECEAGLFPAEVPESNRQREREENYKNLSNTPVTRLFFIVEEVVEIRSRR